MNEQILFDIRLDNIILRGNLIEALASAAAASAGGPEEGAGSAAITATEPDKNTRVLQLTCDVL